MVKCTQFILKISESANPYSSNVLILLKQAAENDKLQYKYVNTFGHVGIILVDKNKQPQLAQTG